MPSPIYILHTIAFLDLLAVGLILPQVSSHVRKLGGNHMFVGLMGAIYAGFQLGSGPLIGSLSDFKGRKYILILTLILCSGGYTFIGLTDSIIVILIIRAFLGLFKQTQMLTRALVPDYERGQYEQSDIYGKMATISGAGITLGPIIGGHVAEDFPENAFKFLALGVGILFIINAGLASLLPKTRVKEKLRDVDVSHTITCTIKESVLELYKIDWLRFWDVFFFKGLIGFTMGVYYTNYASYLRIQFGLSPKNIGYVVSFQGVVGSICSYFISYINKLYKSDKDYTQRNFHVFLVMSISIIGVILSNYVYMYVLWLIPLAISNAIGRLITLEMILKRSRGEHRATMIGAANSVRSLSGVIAPMVAGVIGQYIGVIYVVYACLFSTIIGTILSYHVRTKSQKENIHVETERLKVD